jgi:hypothetical protein
MGRNVGTHNTLVSEKPAYTNRRAKELLMNVFLSDAGKDGSLAATLASVLAESGVDVWNPDEEIVPGDNWAMKVGKALEAADAMIILLTPETVDSEWLRRQVEYALTTKKYQGMVVPVILGTAAELPDEIPWILLRLDPIWLDRDHPDFTQVVNRVAVLAK